MRVIKISSNVSKMSNEEIEREIISGKEPARIQALLNEAHIRKNIRAFLLASDNRNYVNYPPILKQLVNAVMTNSNAFNHCEQIIRNIMEYSGSIDGSTLNKIIEVALVSPRITSVLILHQNTPNAIIDALMRHLHLNIVTKTSMDNSQYLQAIISDLSSGGSWDNDYSGSMIMPRLHQSGRDSFLTEVSKFNITPLFAGQLLHAADLFSAQNPSLRKNLQTNTQSGVEIAKIISNKNWDTVSPEEVIPQIIKRFNEGANTGSSNPNTYAQWMWNMIKEKINTIDIWEIAAFTEFYDGENLIDVMLKMLPDIIPDLINIIKKSNNLNSIKSSLAYGKIIHIGLNNPTYQKMILELPEEYFRMIRTTQEDAKIIQEHFKPKAESFDELKEFEDLMATRKDWYMRYSTTS